MTTPKLGGGRKRRFFKEKTEAETFMQFAKVQQENYGTAALSFPTRSGSRRSSAVSCCNRSAQRFAMLPSFMPLI